MNARGMVRRAGLTLGVGLLAVSAYAQATATQKPAQQPFEPKSGQAGKDVVWVPTPQTLVDKMLDLAKVTPQDLVMDLGSGDGRTVITAAKRGATAIGIEYNPDMVELSKRNAAKEGASAAKASFVKGDLFETDFSKATVLTMFLLPEINIKLRPRILNMKPGTRVVSNSFTMEDWEADQSETVSNECTSWCTAYPLDRPGESRGHMADAAGRSQAHAGVSEAVGNAWNDQDRGQDERRPDHVHRRQGLLYRPRERQLDSGHRSERLDRHEALNRRLATTATR